MIKPATALTLSLNEDVSHGREINIPKHGQLKNLEEFERYTESKVKTANESANLAMDKLCALLY